MRTATRTSPPSRRRSIISAEEPPGQRANAIRCQTWLQVAQATGAKFDDYIGETSPAGMQTDLGYMTQLAQEGILSFVEGGNEEDDSYPASLGNTLATTALLQQQLYATAQQLRPAGHQHELRRRLDRGE